MSQVAVITGFVFCCVLIATLVATLTIGLRTRGESKCDPKSEFIDLPNTFSMEQQWISAIGALKITNGLGTYATDFAVGTRYIFRDSRGFVVAQASRGVFSRTFAISRCNPLEKDGITPAPTYELEQDWFSFGKVEYDLRKNGILIAEPSKSTLFTCKADIIMQDPKGETIATCERSCGESYFRDTWYMRNYKNTTEPGAIENYVIGFMAYLTTAEENNQKTKKKT
jgi:hypothetical protein